MSELYKYSFYESKHFNLLEDEQKRIITSVYSDHLLSLGELREEYCVFMSNAEIVAQMKTSVGA